MFTMFIYVIKDIDDIMVTQKLLGYIHEIQGHVIKLSINIHNGL